ncbi:hypothetical protein AUC70_07820 [Methyloceanibacter stevinii]|uniref:VRR-NUC domain-containing protein n=1 Tax=Methyloceanibacter stevinii TaxID=1774970 RepID=A0A1E3VLZ7_9HYPH|nr:VRR-NUC domain-containing protein [Methyloceanibacter stevinii]ODR94537.1 hypothetical protein AUC70_07820 [Methyloceanibacter stevinii]
MDHSCCAHESVTCLNEYELLRKYRCASCQGVMMCACDEAFGRRFLTHQLEEGVDLDTQERVPVTLGFQANVCNSCRGLPLDPAPTAAIPGRTSKIKRFYWRELFFAETQRTADWQDANPDVSPEEIQSAQRQIAKEVLEEMKALHAATPQYDMREPSQSEVLERLRVEIEALHPAYVSSPRKGAVVMWENEVVAPETYAAHHYRALGWSVMPLESVPLHALFGVLMWPLIEDPGDPKNRIVSFGSRGELDTARGVEVFMINLPEDFGGPSYGRRRVNEIGEHLALLSPGDVPDRNVALDLFNDWRDPSERFRQYLWAHRAADVDRARRLIEVLPTETIIAILWYLVGDYWGRYVGWPDLLLWRDEAFMMVEVKSSSDKLSADQMRWVADNHESLKLPFRIAKLHRKRSVHPAG